MALPERIDCRKPIGAELLRIVRTEAQSAVAQLADLSREASDCALASVGIVRGVLRLVKSVPGAPGPGEREGLDSVMDALRQMSGPELMDVYDGLRDHVSPDMGAEPFPQAGHALREWQASRTRERPTRSERAAHLREELEALRERSSGWRLDGVAGFDDIAPGMQTTYRSARRGMRSLGTADGVRPVHGLRHDLEDHGSQVGLIAGAWPEALQAHGDAAARAADQLSEYDRLTALLAAMEDCGARAAATDECEVLAGLIERRQQDHRKKAEALCLRILGEVPRAFRDRVAACWQAWREERAWAELPEQSPPVGAP